MIIYKEKITKKNIYALLTKINVFIWCVGIYFLHGTPIIYCTHWWIIIIIQIFDFLSLFQSCNLVQ